MLVHAALPLIQRIARLNEIMGQIEELVPNMDGWCSVEKAKWLASRILTEGIEHVVEIGVFAGRSLLPMALAMKALNNGIERGKGIVIGIDPYTMESALEGVQPEENERWWKQQNIERYAVLAQQKIDALGLNDFCILMVETSQQALALFEDESIGLLHIDGNHSPDVAVRDVETWLPKVSPGGVIVLDDTDWATVQKAREILTDRCKKIIHSTTWEAFRK